MLSSRELQRTQDDPTANTPERSGESEGLVVDNSDQAPVLAPEPSPPDDPEVVNHGGQPALIDSTHEKPQITFKISLRRAIIIFLSVLCLIALAVGLGVGLGIKAHDNSSSSPQPSPTAASTLPAATNLPQASNTPLARGILNDSAVGAVTQIDGTRHVFFQDVNGTIRQATLGNGSTEWDVSWSDSVATDAKLGSPLSAFLRLNAGPVGIGNQIYLFYINLNGSLALTTFVIRLGWSGGALTTLGASGIIPQRGSFSAAAIVDTATIETPNFGILLTFLDSDHGATAFYGYEQMVDVPTQSNSSSVDVEFNWTDVTATFFGYPVNSNEFMNSTFSNIVAWNQTAAFEVNALSTGSSPANYDDSDYYQLRPNVNASILPNLEPNIASGNVYPPSNSSIQVPTPILIKANNTLGDENIFLRQIENGTLAIEEIAGQITETSNPTSKFPFTNVAVTIPSGVSSSKVYLYHQLNETAFAEDIWDDDAGSWTSNVFVVDAS